MDRRARVVITVGVVALLFAPVLADHDGFPLSTYPMYSRTRSEVVSFVSAYGVDAAGRRHTLSLETIGASDDPLIVAGELRAAIRAGRADARCAEIAERVAATQDDSGSAAIVIEVVAERHDVINRVAGDASLVSLTVHARCDVEERV